MNPLTPSSARSTQLQSRPTYENKNSESKHAINHQSAVNIAIEISQENPQNAPAAGDVGQTKILTGMTKLHGLAKAGNEEAVDMLMQLSAHSNDVIAEQAQAKILALNTSLNVPPHIKLAVSELALALYSAQKNQHDAAKSDRLLSGILYLAGAQASSNGERLTKDAIEEKLSSRNPQKQIDPALVDNILNPGRLVPSHEIYNNAQKLGHLQHIENLLRLGGEISNASIRKISECLHNMQESPSGHKVVEALIHGNNHYITALFSLGSDGKINCDCLDTHSESIPDAENQLRAKLNAVLPVEMGAITFTQNDALQRNNACGVVNLMLLQHLDKTLSTLWPDATLNPASPPPSAKPSIKNMIDDFSRQLGKLNDPEKDAVFSAKRAEIIADWPAEKAL